MATRADPLRETLDPPLLESLVLGPHYGLIISRRLRQFAVEAGDP